MKTATWVQRLTDQFPGWFFWYDDQTVFHPWRAVPAPEGTTRQDASGYTNRIQAPTPQQLRDLVQERYGWDDICETCGVLARECGHRQPEREKTRDVAT